RFIFLSLIGLHFYSSLTIFLDKPQESVMKSGLIISLLLSTAFTVNAAQKTVNIYQATTKGAGDKIGTVVISETPYGLVFTPALNGLAVGIHGFHIHEKGSCEPSTKGDIITPAGAPGGHYDPQKTAKHLGPYNANGHLGALPALHVNAKGQATYPVLAPRLKTLAQINGRALMIHAGGDNHSDEPQTLGGGGARLACGVIE